MFQELIDSYAKNPVNNHIMENATIDHHEGNSLCGDDITVYLKITDNKIDAYSYSGNCSTITSAAASFLSDIIINENIDDILSRNYDTMKKNDFVVSPRRKRAAVIAILAARNAIHKYKQDNTIDTFDDLLYNE